MFLLYNIYRNWTGFKSILIKLNYYMNALSFQQDQQPDCIYIITFTCYKWFPLFYIMLCFDEDEEIVKEELHVNFVAEDGLSASTVNLKVFF